MSSEASNLRIGIFIVLAIVLVVGGVLAWGGATYFERSILMETYFAESVEGLDVGAPFKFRGVEIGKVKSVHMASDVYGTRDSQDEYERYVVVRASITIPRIIDETEEQRLARTQVSISEGLRVRLASRGITGVKFLEADYLDPERHPVLDVPWEPALLYVPSSPGTFTKIVESAELFLENLKKTDIEAAVTSANDLLVSTRKTVEALQVDELRDETGELIASLARSAARIETLVSDPALDSAAGDLAAILHDVEGVTGAFDEPTDRQFLGDAFAAMASIRELTAELPAAVEQMTTTLRRIDLILAETERGLGDIVANLRATTLNLKLFSSETLAYPARTLFGDPPPETQTGEE